MAEQPSPATDKEPGQKAESELQRRGKFLLTPEDAERYDRYIEEVRSKHGLPSMDGMC